VVADLALSLAMLALSGTMLTIHVLALRKVWRGELSSVFVIRLGDVPGRDYPALMLWFGSMFLGLFLYGVTYLLETVSTALRGHPVAVTPGRIGMALLLCALPLTLVHASVALFGRPRFLVPPPFRHEPGAIPRWRASRERHRS
jgi:hypothetical protein